MLLTQDWDSHCGKCFRAVKYSKLDQSQLRNSNDKTQSGGHYQTQTRKPIQFKKKSSTTKESAFILKFGEGVFDIKKLKSGTLSPIAGPSFQAGVRNKIHYECQFDSKTELLEGSLAITPSARTGKIIRKNFYKLGKSLQKIDQYLKLQIILENQSIKTNKSDDNFLQLSIFLRFKSFRDCSSKGKTNPRVRNRKSTTSSIDSAFEDKARSRKLNSTLHKNQLFKGVFVGGFHK